MNIRRKKCRTVKMLPEYFSRSFTVPRDQEQDHKMQISRNLLKATLCCVYRRDLLDNVGQKLATTWECYCDILFNVHRLFVSYPAFFSYFYCRFSVCDVLINIYVCYIRILIT